MNATQPAPLVSVCIPCFNSAAFVGEAIQSALAQTHPRVEIVVVDDGSTDQSVEILRAFGDTIRLDAGPNRGACAARNRALELSSGRYIQFLDADDRLCPQKFERQLPLLESGDADLVFCRGFLFGDGRPLRPKLKPILDPSGFDPFAFCLKQGLSTEGPLHRKSALERVGGFRAGVKRAQEFDLHVRLGATGARIHLLDELLYEHRHHDGEGRITRTPQAPDQMVLLLLELSEILESAPYEFSPERRAALAGVLFQHSIYAFRNGAPQSAERGFARARALAKRFDYEERRLYKSLAGVLGASRVERALGAARRARSLKQGQGNRKEETGEAAQLSSAQGVPSGAQGAAQLSSAQGVPPAAAGTQTGVPQNSSSEEKPS